MSVHPALAAWMTLRASAAPRAALVTLLRADGGSARTLGTHLALTDGGGAVGSVTVGGCADGQALRVAAEVLVTGDSRQLTVPLSEEDALALGLGCAGQVDLLVERVSLAGNDPSARAFDGALAATNAGERVALLAPLNGAGGRLLVRGDGRTEGTVGDAARDAAGTALGLQLLRGSAGASGVREQDGERWFVELLEPVRTLLIVGATEIAATLCALVVPLGWRAVLLDPRDDVLAQPRFAAASERIPSIPSEIVSERVAGAGGPAVVVVAHDYRVELPVLRAALRGGAPYVGMLGSRKRGATVRAMLLEDGLTVEEVARLRNPIGLSIGAEGPAEIAVSIVAELIATWRGRPATA